MAVPWHCLYRLNRASRHVLDDSHVQFSVLFVLNLFLCTYKDFPSVPKDLPVKCYLPSLLFLSPGKCLGIISLTFDEVFDCLGIFIRTIGRDDVFPFGHTDLLKTLFQQWNQCGSIALLVCRQVRSNLWLKAGEHLREQKLGSKVGLVGHNASSHLLPVHSERYLDPIGLLQAILNHSIWQPIGFQRSPLIVSVKLGSWHGLEEIRHGCVVGTVVGVIIIVT